MVKDYEGFKKEVFQLSSIDLNAYKERQMKRRIDSLIHKNGYKNYEDYLQALKKDREEYERFIAYLTINVSEFFRNPSQWDVLEKEILPYLFQHFNRNIKIWSAACSTGDEPYSLAMVMSKFVSLTSFKIYATDIDQQILSKAQVGLYNEKAVSSVPKDFKGKYLQSIGNSFKITDEIKRCIEFKKHNLLKDSYPRDLELIVCRNVLIYFTEHAKSDIYQKFNRSLKLGGILFVGSTEQIIQAPKFGFEPIRSFFYKKVAEV